MTTESQNTSACGETAGVGTGDLLGPIYLVLCGWDYEGEDVKAILRTKEEADAVAEKYRDRDLFSYDDVRVQEWHVGEITDRRWEKTKP
jgi:hypothetical protein